MQYLTEPTHSLVITVRITKTVRKEGWLQGVTGMWLGDQGFLTSAQAPPPRPLLGGGGAGTALTTTEGVGGSQTQGWPPAGGG